MCSPSNFANGSSIGAEPVAITTLVPVSVCVLPSAAVIWTWRFSSRRPLPANGLILFALNSIATPPVNCLTILSLRPTILLTSIAASLAVMPWTSKAWVRLWNCLDESSRALDGMQPTLRQVPPSAGLPSLPMKSSMQATDRPSWAARIAAW